MKRLKFIFLYLSFGLSFLNFRGQVIGNYVSNGSFESLNSFSATTLYNVVNYWQPIDTGKYQDYLGTTLPPFSNAPGVLGYQWARTGNNYIVSSFYGMRGYPRNRLKQKLVANKVYCAKFHVVNTNNNPYAIDGFAMYFSTSTIDTIKYCNIPLTYLTPQISNPNGNIIIDTLAWIPITGTFVATGQEKYLVLGNFKSDAATNTVVNNPTFSLTITADICIDDVSVIELNLQAFAGSNMTIFSGDSVFIGRQPDFAIDPGCRWFKLPNMTTAFDTISGLWVKPSVTSTYVVRQELDCSSLKWDTVVVTVSHNLISLNKLQLYSDNISLFPNPTTEYLGISFSGNALPDIISYFITDNLGQSIREEDLHGTFISVSTSDLTPGLYQIHFKTHFGTVTKKFVKTN